MTTVYEHEYYKMMRTREARIRTLRRSSTTVRCTLDMLSESMSVRIPCLKVEIQRVIREFLMIGLLSR